MKQLLILGAGGHGQVVFDLAEQLGIYDRIDFLDDGQELGIHILKGTVVGKLNDYKKFRHQYTDAIVAIGNNEVRLQWLMKLESHYKISTLIHPSSFVSLYATVKSGTVVLAQAVINTNARVGNGVIVNSGAIIGSNVLVEKCCLVDLGEIIRRNDVVKR